MADPVDEFPTSTLRVTADIVRRVAAALAEVLPADRYRVTASPQMAFDGIQVEPLFFEPGEYDPYWYFDGTFGGDDGHTDHFRIYFSNAALDLVDDHDPPGAPRVDDDPIVIAQWIAAVVEAGPPV